MFLDKNPVNLTAGDIAEVQFAGNTSYVSFCRGDKCLQSMNPGQAFVFDTGKSEEIEQMLDLIAWAGGFEAVRISDQGRCWKWRFDKRD